MVRYSKLVVTIIVGLIFLIGLTTRFLWLDITPPSLNWDEVSLGYNAYSLALTGKDEFGEQFPIVLRSFDDYKPALYSYLSIPFIRFFGLNALGVRALSAIAGIFTVLAVMTLTQQFFKDRFTTLIAGVLTIFSLWGIFFSHAAFEANLGVPFVLFGIYFCLKDRKKYHALGFLLFGLSMHTYQVYKLLVPLILIGLTVLQKKIYLDRKKIPWLSWIILGIIVLPLINLYISNPLAAGRLNSTVLITEESLQDFDNLILNIIGRYLSYFSPINLFYRGSPEPTQQISGFGMFHAIEIVFYLIGLYSIFVNWKKYKTFIMLFLLLPLPAAITWNWFYPARVLVLFAFITIVIAVGSKAVFDYARSKNNLIKLGLGLVLLLYVFQVGKFLLSYRYNFTFTERGSWQYGMKEILTEVDKIDENYNRVIFETRTAQPHVFTLFYTKYNPDQYHQEIIKLGGIPQPRKNFDIGKYTFRDVYWPTDQYERDVLLIAPESSLPWDKVDKNANVDYKQELKDIEGNTLVHIVGIH